MRGFSKAVFSLAVVSASIFANSSLWAQSTNQQLPFPFSNAPSASNRQSDTPTSNPAQTQPSFELPNLQGPLQNRQDETKQEKDAEETRLNIEKPLTGFQHFVFETTGRLLPNFGDSALQKVMPTDKGSQPVSADYEVGPGDEINIRVWGGINIDTRVVVDREGQEKDAGRDVDREQDILDQRAADHPPGGALLFRRRCRSPARPEPARQRPAHQRCIEIGAGPLSFWARLCAIAASKRAC